jgi:glycosyltransferase involved in cell wall biosynthesis
MMKKQSIYIDAQVFQTAAWHRGMGKYSLELVKNLILETDDKDGITLLFNATLPVPDLIKELLQQEGLKSVYLDLILPREPRDRHSVQAVRLQNKNILTDYFDRLDEASPAFMILALYLDEVCPVFPDSAGEKLLVYYDSIPYLYHERYDQFKGFFDHFYLPHTASIYDATRILTISNTVANDLKIFFGIPENRMTTIDGAAIPKVVNGTPRRPSALEGVDRFILSPSGQELRKNNYRAMRAFRSFVHSTNEDIKLVVTSYFTEEARRELEEESGGTAIFTGNVASEEIDWLYEHSEAVFFPTEYEGLGLPALEAVNENKIVLCSDISVFREISQDGFMFFDPLDEESMKTTLTSFVNGEGIPDIATEYPKIKKHYTWKRSATLTNKALLIAPKPKVEKKRIAILCPDPSGFSAVGKVVAETHPAYSEYFDIDYYFDKGNGHRHVRPNVLKYVSGNKLAKNFTRELYDQYDAVIYHIGNSEYHIESMRSALSMPGYIILHDTHLDGLFLNLVEMGFISDERLRTEIAIDTQLAKELETNDLFSTKLATVVNYQKGVIVHSEYAKEAVKQLLVGENVSNKVAQINLPVDTELHSVRQRHQNNSEQPVIALAGIIAGIKGIGLIESIAQNPRFEHCLVKVFGFNFAQPEEMQRLALLPNVQISENPTDFEFQRNMGDVNILVNVRQDYRGETSLTTLEAMRYGAAVIVKKVGWYDELPDDSVCKVEGNDQVGDMVEALVSDDELRLAVTETAIQLMDDQFTHDNYAKEMLRVIEG